ncbi:LacI family DNA-binding transcriptional regulator [Actinoplanes sp. NPDC049265]|uniref:LacI family DNA-binding transcriptional regulator n=1 Tax=Actinoplanes sp. NPDC049265 TaxID=3363902 RepID=UPI0037227E2D
MPGTGRRRQVSMAHIAERAGVSITTVSHVINKTRPVRPETEQAVLTAIAEAGYVPDAVVRSQRTAGSQTIGLAMSAISNTYFGDVVHGIEQAAATAGYSLLLTDTHDEVAGELRAVSDLLSRHVEAIILAPSADPAAALQHARKRGVPVVVIDRLIDDEVDQVGSENRGPTADLVTHLAGLGHRRIAMIGGRSGLSTSDERLAGYRDGLERSNLPYAPELVRSGDSQDEPARQALHALMARPEPPTGVVVGNNRMTIGAMRAVRELGLRVPDDLALVAFDDFEWADLFHPRLTVIAQPTQPLGAQALRLVMSRLADPALPPRRLVMKPAFVHRDSCGCGQPARTAPICT